MPSIRRADFVNSATYGPADLKSVAASSETAAAMSWRREGQFKPSLAPLPAPPKATDGPSAFIPPHPHRHRRGFKPDLGAALAEPR